MQKTELIDEFLDRGTELVEDDKKMKEEKEMCKDISTSQNQNCITMKERVEESPSTVMKSEEKEYITAEHDYVVIKDERVPYEECIQTIYQTIG